jgi:hypothetical protein
VSKDVTFLEKETGFDKENNKEEIDYAFLFDPLPRQDVDSHESNDCDLNHDNDISLENDHDSDVLKLFLNNDNLVASQNIQVYTRRSQENQTSAIEFFF